MKQENQRKLDDFFKTSFQKNIGHVNPSDDFTDKVIAQLNHTQFNTTKYNKPLFSSRVKWTLGIFISSLLLVSFYFSATSEASQTYQLPPSVVNLLNYYSEFFTSGDNLLMMISAVSLGFWSLMLLDKVIQKLSLT